jgi:hypothetical protein
LSVFWSQVGHKPIPRLAQKTIHSSGGTNIGPAPGGQSVEIKDDHCGVKGF